MRKILLLTVLLGFLAPAGAQDNYPKEGQTYQSFQVDVNGDGKPDKVGLVAYRVSEQGYYGRLTVWDSSGKLLWQAPQVTEPTAPLAFGGWDAGVCNIQVVGDVDGDGKVEVLSPAMQSDVRPTTFRIFRWTGSAFAVQPARQLLEAPQGSGNFPWAKPTQWSGSTPATWVGSLERKGSNLTAQIYVTRSGSDIKLGEARMVIDKKGFRVGSWIKKPQ